MRVLPAEGFLPAVRALAADLAVNASPRSMRVIKAQLRSAPFQQLADATLMANAEMAKCRDTEDFREGVASFVEKRAPNFTGR